jgi:metal-responsive CopG/Arc/MetJ family transcriptional regulator
MKTAISIPDPLFAAAEEYAHEQGLSRSELYARALREYLQQRRYQGIREALDAVYGAEASGVDPAVAAAQARLMQSDEW